jgi:hypothetical protein
MKMRYHVLTAVVALSALVIATPAGAHHSVPGTFKVDQTIALKGTITRIDWINPHIYIYVDVKEKDGAVTNWKVETLPTNHMRRAGVSKAAIWDQAKGGDITVHGNPGLNGKALLFLLRITFADGTFYHLYGDPKDIPTSTTN